MIDLKQFLHEMRSLTWDRSPSIGWWENKDSIRFYHGTHKNNIKNIFKTGLEASQDWISLALEPNTAHGYASMSGGERNFRSAGGKAVHVPEKDRVVLVFDIPMSWVRKNMNTNLRGNMPNTKKRLTDKSEYDKWSREDQEYYALTELRFKEVPRKYLKGYMIKK